MGFFFQRNIYHANGTLLPTHENRRKPFVDGLLGTENLCETTYPLEAAIELDTLSRSGSGTFFGDALLFEEFPIVQHSTDVRSRPKGTIAYVLVIVRCPDWCAPGVDETLDPGSKIFEVSAMIKNEISKKYGICNYQSECGAVPYHTYDRVSMLQSSGFREEILSQPITDDLIIEHGQIYIQQNNESDVGIRDSRKLQIFSLVEHPVAVLMDYDTILLSPLDYLIVALLEDPSKIGYYSSHPSCDINGNTNVDTGFLIIKSSIEELNNIISSYLTTPYDPISGWNYEGHHHCRGKLGLNGLIHSFRTIFPRILAIMKSTDANTIL